MAIKRLEEMIESVYFEDAQRIQLICFKNGYLVDLPDCIRLWENYSSSMAAGWMFLHKDDDFVWNCIKTEVESEAD